MTVHVVFKTHLDVGFTDYASKVVEAYFNDFVPRAMTLAAHLRDQPQRFRWTVGSWLVYEYLEKASPQARRQMEAAIEAGDMIWHALPFTTHTELMDAHLFRYGLSFAQKLDQRFGKKTIAAKMTDVPGHTRAMIPLLAEAGVEYLHIGVNEASMPPDVPPVFVWKHEASGTDIIMMYEHEYGSVTTIPQLNETLAIIFTGDNLGPPTTEMVAETYQKLQARFPGEPLVASSLDAFAERLRAIRHELPVITSEIGDTWIHGAGTDPTKVRHYRALSRLVSEHPDDSQFDPLRYGLLLTAEHTWGMDEKTHLADSIHYTQNQLAEARKTPLFQRFEASWAEQRAYIETALKTIEGSPVAPEAQQVLAEAQPTRPNLQDYQPVTQLETAHFEVGWDESSGALTHLTHKTSGTVLADTNHPMALFRYELFSAGDYERFWSQYIRASEANLWWAREDYKKPGLPVMEHREWQGKVEGAFTRVSDVETRLLFELTLPPDSLQYGAPKTVYLEYVFPDAESRIDIRLQWFGKSACRLAEAFWLSFVPPVSQPENWHLEKMGQLISPLDVVSNGARHLHAIERGAFYEDEKLSLQIRSADAPLVAPGKPSLLDFTNQLPPLDKGMHFNLYNNIWGTNFPMWFEDDALFRFSVVASSAGKT